MGERDYLCAILECAPIDEWVRYRRGFPPDQDHLWMDGPGHRIALATRDELLDGNGPLHLVQVTKLLPAAMIGLSAADRGRLAAASHSLEVLRREANRWAPASDAARLRTEIGQHPSVTRYWATLGIRAALTLHDVFDALKSPARAPKARSGEGSGLLTVKEYAAHRRCSADHVRRMCRQGMPHSRNGKGVTSSILIDAAIADAWMQAAKPQEPPPDSVPPTAKGIRRFDGKGRRLYGDR